MKVIEKIKALSKENKLGLAFLLGALLLFGLDIFSKWLIQLNYASWASSSSSAGIEIIPNFFYIALSHNEGAAFSFGANLGVFGRIAGIVISLVMSVAIMWYSIRHNKGWRNRDRVAAMLLFSGAIGNLIDRAFYFAPITGFSGVIDWLSFYLGGGPSKPSSFVNPFATFNLADAYLVIGVIYLLVLLLIEAIKEKSPLREDPRLQKEEKKEDEQIQDKQ